eukprot:1635762-Pyramimonas_sp.AAC.1
MTTTTTVTTDRHQRDILTSRSGAGTTTCPGGSSTSEASRVGVLPTPLFPSPPPSAASSIGAWGASCNLGLLVGCGPPGPANRFRN